VKIVKDNDDKYCECVGEVYRQGKKKGHNIILLEQSRVVINERRKGLLRGFFSYHSHPPNA
jgi:hypothetical protein